jgi:regulator of sirC expression with transglutaminase-like and TPR domain
VAQPSPPGRLQALVELLGDERERIRAAAEAALEAEALEPARLRALVERVDDSTVRARARQRLEAVRMHSLERELEALVARGADIEEGAFLLARMQYPELDVAAYRDVLDRMAAELGSRLASATPRSAACTLLRQFLHEEHGFKGNVQTYADPENVFLNRVLDRKIGIPTSLACIYLLVARRLGLALEPVNLPLHFLVRFSDEQGETFIDAFAQGRILTRADCREFLREAGLAENPRYLVRASDRAVLARLVRCLVASFRTSGATRTAERFERSLAIVGEGP